MSVTTERLTVEEFLDRGFPRGTQLIRGEVVVNEPSQRHDRIAFFIARLLANWIEDGPGHGEAAVHRAWSGGDRDYLVPDAWWVSDERRPPRDAMRADWYPDLVVEVRSPSTWRYDLGPKRAIYERGGVAELWLVDLASDSVLVNRRSTPEATGFDVVLELGRGERLTSPLLPAFEIPLDDLFDR